MSILSLEVEDLVELVALKLKVRQLQAAFNAFAAYVNGEIDDDELCDALEDIDPAFVDEDDEDEDESVDSEDDDDKFDGSAY